MSVGEYTLEKAPETRANIEHALERLSGISYRTWRHEDVIFEKRRWADEMIAYLELEVSPEAVGQIVEQIDIVLAQKQPEKHIRKVTPGVHREKLTAAEIATLDEVFAPLLGRFGYQ